MLVGGEPLPDRRVARVLLAARKADEQADREAVEDRTLEGVDGERDRSAGDPPDQRRQGAGAPPDPPDGEGDG